MKVMIKPAIARPLGVRNTPITENIKPKTHRIQPSTGTQPRNNPNKASTKPATPFHLFWELLGPLD